MPEQTETECGCPPKPPVSAIDEPYEFRIGRNMKRGTKCPGILVINNRYEFTSNKLLYSDPPRYLYFCVKFRDRDVHCIAKAVVVMYNPGNGQDPYPVITKYDREHRCVPNIPRALAAKARHEMKKIILKVPRKRQELPYFVSNKVRIPADNRPRFSLQEAIDKVRNKYIKIVEVNPEFAKTFLKELGTDDSMKQMLIRQQQFRKFDSDHKWTSMEFVDNENKDTIESVEMMEEWEHLRARIHDSKSNATKNKEEYIVSEEMDSVSLGKVDIPETRIELQTIPDSHPNNPTKEQKMEFNLEQNMKENLWAFNITSFKDIESILKDAELFEYLDAFKNAKIDGETLYFLNNEEDLRDLFEEIDMPFGDRVRLRKAIERLQSAHDQTMRSGPGAVEEEDYLLLGDLVAAAHRAGRAEFVSLSLEAGRREALATCAVAVFRCETHSVGEHLVIVADCNSSIPVADTFY